MIRFNLRTAHRVICVSKATRRRLENIWQTPGKKIEVFPNGVDINLHRSYPETRMNIRASFGLQDQRLIIFVGGFYPWHDVIGLLKALQLVVSTHPDTHLLLVGEGQQRLAMEKYSKELGIQDKTIFTGWVPFTDVPHLISAADIAVAPYPKIDQGEFWFSPMKLFEYMACSKAIVASNLGQIADVIRDGENGLLVPAGNSDALAIALIKLIERPELGQRLGEQARSDAVVNYSWEQYISRLISLYHTVNNEVSKDTWR
jgi:glycosyltransferase involved in cell wall biosynthesis